MCDFQLFLITLQVELVRMEPRNGCVSASDTYLSILTEPKSFLQLIHMKNFKNAYLFTTMPKDVTLQSVIDYAAANGQDYVILYEQVFDTKRFGFLRKVSQNLQIDNATAINNEQHFLTVNGL